MACTSLCCIGDGGCIEAITNGADGTSMTIVNGVPVWATGSATTITSGVGPPAGTANAPTIYTDTASGNIYWRDNHWFGFLHIRFSEID